MIQDNKIAWIKVVDIKQKRSRSSTTTQVKRPKPHAFHVVYSVPTSLEKTENVCRKFYMTLTCIKNNNLFKLVKSEKKIEAALESATELPIKKPW